MGSTTDNGNNNNEDNSFVFSVKTKDWDHYAQYRPSYPLTMFTSWLAHHSGPLNSIMDVGTGGGVGAAQLLAAAQAAGHSHIAHVYLSDPNAANLAAAKQQFTTQAYPFVGAFHFHVGPAEEPFPGVEAGSVDMLIACASLHWMDVDAAMQTFATMLRPGGCGGSGTFGAVVYPQPTVRGGETELAEALAGVFQRRREFQALQDDGAMKAVRARAYSNLSIGLDYVPFEESLWTRVRRRTANLVGGEWPLRATTWKEYGQPKNSVREGEEEVEMVEYDEWWSRKGYTVALLKEYFQTLGYEAFVMDGRLWETEAFKRLERLVEERGGEFELVWPVATVLASRK